MSSTKKFTAHFRSSRSSAEPASYYPSKIEPRSLASRPRVAGRGTRAAKPRLSPQGGQAMNESPSEPHDTVGSLPTRSSSGVAQESIPSASSNSGDADGTPDAPQPQPHDNGGHSSPFTPYTKPSAEQTLWEVTVPLFNANELKPGQIYVYGDPNRKESIYKAGMTERMVLERMNEHEVCCKFKPEKIYSSNRDIKNCGRLEKLIAWDLGNRRMLRPCSNRANGHTEWFNVDKDTLINTVKQWENFMEYEKPYDVKGNLSIVWRYLLQKRSPRAADIRKMRGKARLKEWAAILASPTYQDYAYAYLSHVDSEWQRFRGWKPESYWQLSTVIYSLWTLALSRNMIAFCALIIVLGCAGNTLLPKTQFENKQSKKKALQLSQERHLQRGLESGGRQQDSAWLDNTTFIFGHFPLQSSAKWLSIDGLYN